MRPKKIRALYDTDVVELYFFNYVRSLYVYCVLSRVITTHVTQESLAEGHKTVTT